MVNGNYVLYGDRPSSESEVVDDHVHVRSGERKCRRKSHRAASEHRHTKNSAQPDNETDSVKYEKKVKEPRLLRYVPTADVAENFVNGNFETYDMKAPGEPPRRHTFTKKARNPTDGSVNYGYSRSSSSSPTGNLPTISELGEQHGTYRARAPPSPSVSEIITDYENKFDKYFPNQKQMTHFTAKGSHPDSLYRVSTRGNTGTGRLARWLRMLRWPAALVTVCVALTVFVYFLIPNNIEQLDAGNMTIWEAGTHSNAAQHDSRPDIQKQETTDNKIREQDKTRSNTRGFAKPSEIDFYSDDGDKKIDPTTITADTISGNELKRKLPILPIFPSHITPEVQYGNERVDNDKLRTAKAFEGNLTPIETTLKPHITQQPEKPLSIYLTERNSTINNESNTGTDSIKIAETVNRIFDLEKQTETTIKNNDPYPTLLKELIDNANAQGNVEENIKQYPEIDVEIPPEVREFYGSRPTKPNVNFTSGHSKIFGISIEDADKMKPTTQSSAYHTRVSPTLPTWHDRDATTKKDVVNTVPDVAQCGSTRLALCRGVLPYDLAGPPAFVDGVDITLLLPQIEYLAATNCSSRLAQFACALLEPECNPPPYPPKMPCYNLCRAIVDSCENYVPRELSSVFNCNHFSGTNCISAKSPCYQRELACGDGTCVPRDWMCDGTNDCPAGEDEAACSACNPHEYRCQAGTCIQERWICDGYADCPGGEDEAEEVCAARGVAREGLDPRELDEEAAGSAPSPSVRRPNRLPTHSRQVDSPGELESSKELLITSDSNNALKRNYTRRPSTSRLTPYTRPNLQEKRTEQATETKKPLYTRRYPASREQSNQKRTKTVPDMKSNSKEEGDVGTFFDDLAKNGNAPAESDKKVVEQKHTPVKQNGRAPDPGAVSAVATKLDKSSNKMELVIDGASMLKKSAAETEKTPAEEYEEYAEPVARSGHVSPCPSGELRCVDGRCITLAQLCDGTVDCTDHADEDNCYT